MLNDWLKKISAEHRQIWGGIKWKQFT
jgi:hypothetical protein